MTAKALAAAALFAVPAACAQPSTPPEGPVTPVGETPLDTGWKQVEITRGLIHPWSAAWLPDGKTILLTEREGRLRVFTDGAIRLDPVEGLPEISGIGQGGLMDVKLHPGFERNRLVYFTAATGTQSANRTCLFRGRLSEDLTALTDVEELYRVSRDKRGGQHFGSVLTWLSDGSLLMSIGDGGNPPVRLDDDFIRNNAQNPELAFGKTLRMTENGEPHPDNPFFDGDGDAPYVYTYGHRNVQGVAIRPGTQELWSTEHGARGGDELNLLQKGANYGWPKATYSIEYWGPRISESATLEGALDPVAVWTPCIAPCGLTFYTGDAFPEWKGDLLAGGLVLKQIRRVHFNDTGEIEGQTTLQFDDRIRWVGMGPDGGLYILTDVTDGGLYRIEPAS
ncbi:MAG: PQQ-dependent sugar dehydrogenase [Planctomycetota bacterium]